jgi:hypothetical protein
MVLVGLALTGLTRPAPAAAWTDSAVRSARARVAIDGEGTAIVFLEVEVRISGGWLEGLEIAGLDPDLALLQDPRPIAIDDQGRPHYPTVTPRRGGRLQVSFPRRSPRRGRIVLSLAYRTSLAHRAVPVRGEDAVDVSWTLPPWRSGLDGVEIVLIVPPGATAQVAEGAVTERGRSRRADGLVELRWRRPHLPRTQPWTVTARLPRAALGPALRTLTDGEARVVSATPPPPPRSVRDRDPRPFWVGTALLLGLLLVAKELAMRARTRRRGVPSRPWVALPTWLRLPGAAAALACAAVVGPVGPEAGLALMATAVLLGVHAPSPRPLAAPTLGAWHRADGRWLEAARRAARLRALDGLDATRPLGLLVLAVFLALPWVLPPVGERDVVVALACLLPVALLVTGTRRALPPSPLETLLRAMRWAGRAEALRGVAVAPYVHLDVRGRIQAARLRLSLPQTPRGLLRLDLADGARWDLGGRRATPLLVVVTRRGSPAEARLAAAFADVSDAVSPGGRRVARCFDLAREPLEELLGRIRYALADCPLARSEREAGGPSEATVPELPNPAALGY